MMNFFFLATAALKEERYQVGGRKAGKESLRIREVVGRIETDPRGAEKVRAEKVIKSLENRPKSY